MSILDRFYDGHTSLNLSSLSDGAEAPSSFDSKYYQTLQLNMRPASPFAESKALAERQAAQYIGVQGRPKYPSTDPNMLMRWHKQNELVYSCIRAISWAAMDPEPQVQARTGGTEWEAVDGHPCRQLLLWPNPLMDGALFMQALVASANIAGVFYAEIVRNELDQPAQLWPLDPSKVAPIPGEGPEGSPIVSYEWKDTRTRVVIPARNMLVYRFYNPSSPYEGLAPLSVCLGSVDADSAMTDYVRAFFSTGGVPSGVLKIKDRNLDEDQVLALQQKWMAKYGRRGVLKGAPAVLDMSAEYQRTGAQLDELESDKTRGITEARICAAFGVPPILVGAYVALLHVNQRASVKESQRDFWQNTMSPLFRQIRTFMTLQLLPEFEPVAAIRMERIRVAWDMSKVTALSEDLDARDARARENFKAGGLTLNQFLAIIGQPAVPQGDYYLLPRGAAPITAERAYEVASTAVPVSDGGQDPNADDPNADDPGGQGTQDQQTGKEGTADAGKKSGRPTGVKGAFEFEGLQLRRAPTELEKKIGLPSIHSAMETGKARMEKVLMAARHEMIAAAAADLIHLDPGDFHKFALTVPQGQVKQARKALTSTFTQGRASVRRELTDQAKRKGRDPSTFLTAKQDANLKHQARIETLADTALSRLANDVQSRAVSAATAFVILEGDHSSAKARKKPTAKDLEDYITESLDEGSTGYVSRSAQGAANAAYSYGREAEAQDQAGDISEVVYSAVLDTNTCDQCEGDDGETGATEADIPSAPNPGCDGRDQCRCIIIYVLGD